MSVPRTIANECYLCRHRRKVPGDAHLQCAKPDPEMTGRRWGVSNGWFLYPINFDPIWKAKLCCNFEEVDEEF